MSVGKKWDSSSVTQNGFPLHFKIQEYGMFFIVSGNTLLRSRSRTFCGCFVWFRILRFAGLVNTDQVNRILAKKKKKKKRGKQDFGKRSFKNNITQSLELVNKHDNQAFSSLLTSGQRIWPTGNCSG